MKNSPESQWLNKLSERLSGYAEEPDAEVWNKITVQMQDEPGSALRFWTDRLAAAVSVLLLLWSFTAPSNRSGYPSSPGHAYEQTLEDPTLQLPSGDMEDKPVKASPVVEASAPSPDHRPVVRPSAIADGATPVEP